MYIYIDKIDYENVIKKVEEILKNEESYAEDIVDSILEELGIEVVS